MINMNDYLYIIYFEIGIAALILGLFFWLYYRGYASMSCAAALFMYMRRRKDGHSASFTACTGWIKYVARLKGGRRYEFSLDADIKKGDVRVILTDRTKEPLFELGSQSLSDTARVELEEGKRYYIIWKLKKASGDCRLTWRDLDI